MPLVATAGGYVPAVPGAYDGDDSSYWGEEEAPEVDAYEPGFDPLPIRDFGEMDRFRSRKARPHARPADPAAARRVVLERERLLEMATRAMLPAEEVERREEADRLYALGKANERADDRAREARARRARAEEEIEKLRASNEAAERLEEEAREAEELLRQAQEEARERAFEEVRRRAAADDEEEAAGVRRAVGASQARQASLARMREEVKAAGGFMNYLSSRAPREVAEMNTDYETRQARDARLGADVGVRTLMADPTPELPGRVAGAFMGVYTDLLDGAFHGADEDFAVVEDKVTQRPVLVRKMPPPVAGEVPAMPGPDYETGMPVNVDWGRNDLPEVRFIYRLQAVLLTALGVVRLRVVMPRPTSNIGAVAGAVREVVGLFVGAVRDLDVVVVMRSPEERRRDAGPAQMFNVAVAADRVGDIGGMEALYASVWQKGGNMLRSHDNYSTDRVEDQPAATFDHVDIFLYSDFLMAGCVNTHFPGYSDLLKKKWVKMPYMSKAGSNNCVFECLQQHVVESSEEGEDAAPTLAHLREAAGCPRNQMCDRAQLRALCRQVRVECAVYRLGRPEAEEDRSLVGGEYTSFVEAFVEVYRLRKNRVNNFPAMNLLVHEQHCYLLDPRCLGSVRCVWCSKTFAPGKREFHRERCHFCDACKSEYYLKPDAPQRHSCNSARLAAANRERGLDTRIDYGYKIVEPSRKAEDSEDTKDVHVAYFDLETFREQPYVGERVYAGYLINDDMRTEDRRKHMMYGKDTLQQMVVHLREWSEILDAETREKVESCERESDKRKVKPVMGYLVMYNGGKFDHFLMMNELVAQRVPVSEIIMQNGSLMSFTMFGNIRMFDLIRLANTHARTFTLLLTHIIPTGLPWDRLKGLVRISAAPPRRVISITRR